MTPTDVVLCAPEGKCRAIWVDTFDHSSGLLEDCESREAAIKLADAKGGTMLKVHVYDDKGRHIYEAGKF